MSNAGDIAHLASVPPQGAHPGEQTPCVVHRYLCTAAPVTVARGWEPPSIPQPRSTRTAALSLGHEGKEGSTNTARWSAARWAARWRSREGTLREGSRAQHCMWCGSLYYYFSNSRNLFCILCRFGCTGSSLLSLVVVSRGCSLVAVLRLLIPVASLVSAPEC